MLTAKPRTQNPEPRTKNYKERMHRYKYIVTLLAVALMMLTTAVSSVGQGITVNTGEAATFEVSISNVAEDDITWEIYSDFAGINMAVVPGNCAATDGEFVGGDNTGSSVDIIWYTPGTYLVKVKGDNTCPTDNMKFYKVEVVEGNLPVATILQPGTICQGDQGILEIELTGEAPWSLVLFDGVNYTTYDNIRVSPTTIFVNPTVTTTYTVTQVSNINGINTQPSNSVTITVNPRPVNGKIYQYNP
jgi:hypothetical protein